MTAYSENNFRWTLGTGGETMTEIGSKIAAKKAALRGVFLEEAQIKLMEEFFRLIPPPFLYPLPASIFQQFCSS